MEPSLAFPRFQSLCEPYISLPEFCEFRNIGPPTVCNSITVRKLLIEQSRTYMYHLTTDGELHLSSSVTIKLTRLDSFQAISAM